MKSCRPPIEQRCFQSCAIEDAIRDVSERIGDPEVAWLFANCFPNTLDTTVTTAADEDGRPDTFVITGDIDAMWLRDSTNQVWPYLPFVNQDDALKTLIQGVINRQTRCVLIDPYANAFNREPKDGEWMSDITAMTRDLHERKYELDSLCAVIRLAYGYYQASGDASCFDALWNRAMDLIVATIKTEQAGTDEGDVSPYRFQRVATSPNESLGLNGRGNPIRRCGLSRSPFRPSDDATIFPFLVPANAMAAVCLKQLAELWKDVCNRPEAARDAEDLAYEIETAIITHGVIVHPKYDCIYAFEVDGYGAHYLMDDANIPSLLSLPHLGFCSREAEVYVQTRAFILSPDNPYYAEGAAIRGVGGPHVGLGWVWPMSIIMQALTSTSESEIADCLRQLKSTHAGTGFMHETVWKDDAARFTRPWFAWANTLFGELILTLDRERPGFLKTFK
jgi:meiotically up-regulated gene 157 (Mug157) protein